MYFKSLMLVIYTININSRPLLRESFDWPDSWSENEWSWHKETSAGLTPTDDPISKRGGQTIQNSSTSGNGKRGKKMRTVCLDQKDFCEEPKGW